MAAESHWRGGSRAGQEAKCTRAYKATWLHLGFERSLQFDKKGGLNIEGWDIEWRINLAEPPLQLVPSPHTLRALSLTVTCAVKDLFQSIK